MKNVLNVGEDKNWWKSWKITNSLETIYGGFLEMPQQAYRGWFCTWGHMLENLEMPRIRTDSFSVLFEKGFSISKSIMCFFSAKIILHILFGVFEGTPPPPYDDKKFDDSLGGSLFVTKQTWTYFMKALSLKILLNSFTWLLRNWHNSSITSKERNFPLKSASNESHTKDTLPIIKSHFE